MEVSTPSMAEVPTNDHYFSRKMRYKRLENFARITKQKSAFPCSRGISQKRRLELKHQIWSTDSSKARYSKFQTVECRLNEWIETFTKNSDKKSAHISTKFAIQLGYSPLTGTSQSFLIQLTYSKYTLSQVSVK